MQGQTYVFLHWVQGWDELRWNGAHLVLVVP